MTEYPHIFWAPMRAVVSHSWHRHSVSAYTGAWGSTALRAADSMSNSTDRNEASS